MTLLRSSDQYFTFDFFDPSNPDVPYSVFQMLSISIFCYCYCRLHRQGCRRVWRDSLWHHTRTGWECIPRWTRYRRDYRKSCSSDWEWFASEFLFYQSTVRLYLTYRIRHLHTTLSQKQSKLQHFFMRLIPLSTSSITILHIIASLSTMRFLHPIGLYGALSGVRKPTLSVYMNLIIFPFRQC